MDDKNFNLIRLDNKLAEKIYDDVFSSSFQKAWNALWNIIWLVTSITIPIAMMNNYTNFVLQENIRKYEEKLNSIEEKNIIKVEPEIWVPILDKLTYTKNENISDLFLELLKKASNKNELSKTHPRYVKIIENLCEDEAIILNYFHTKNIFRIACLDLVLKNDKDEWINIKRYFSKLNNLDNLKEKNNLESYITNLFSLGIIENPDNGNYIPEENLYKDLKKDNSLIELGKIALNKYKVTNPEYDKVDQKKWMLALSQLWKWFLESIFSEKIK